MRTVPLYDGIYAFPNDLAEEALDIRIPTDEDPGWRPPSLEEFLSIHGTPVAKRFGRKARRRKAEQIAALKRRRGRFYRRKNPRS